MTYFCFMVACQGRYADYGHNGGLLLTFYGFTIWLFSTIVKIWGGNLKLQKNITLAKYASCSNNIWQICTLVSAFMTWLPIYSNLNEELDDGEHFMNTLITIRLVLQPTHWLCMNITFLNRMSVYKVVQYSL